MTKDGRLMIRFGDLANAIERFAAKDDRSPSDWIRRHIRKVIQKRQSEERTAARKTTPGE
jgi:hypothetical protein